MNKKLISKMLVLVMVIQLFVPSLKFFNESFADSNSVNEKIQRKQPFIGEFSDTDNLLITSGIGEDKIYTFLKDSLKMPTKINKEGVDYYLNPYVYKKYKVIAYTTEDESKGVCGSPKLSSAQKKLSQRLSELPHYNINPLYDEEWKFLGYNTDGEIITNDLWFGYDTSQGINSIFNRKFDKIDDAEGTWEEAEDFKYNVDEYYIEEYLHNADDINVNGGEEKYSFKGKGKQLFGGKSYEYIKKRVKVLQDITFSNPATFKLEYGSNHDTLNIMPFDYVLSTKIVPEENVITVPVGTESVDIKYDVILTISDIKTDGEKNRFTSAKAISEESNEGEKSVESKEIDDGISKNDKRKLEFTKKFSFTRTESTLGMIAPNERRVNLHAKSEVTTFDGLSKTIPTEKQVIIKMSADDEVDFTINHKDINVTDGEIIVPNHDFNEPLNLKLEDNSLIQSGDLLYRKWYVRNKDLDEYIKFSDGLDENEEVDFIVNSVTKKYIKNHSLEFKEVIKTDGIEEEKEAIHKVSFVTKEELIPLDNPNSFDVRMSASCEYRSGSALYVAMEGQRFYLRVKKTKESKERVKRGEFLLDSVDAKTLHKGKKYSRVVYYKSGLYNPSVVATGKEGSIGNDNIDLKIIGAKFEPEINVYGTFKENRKLSFSVKNKNNLYYFPIDEKTLRWNIISLDGSGKNYKIDGYANTKKEFDAIFTKKGKYKIVVTGKIKSNYDNNYTVSGTAEKIIEIAEDKKPVADFSVQREYIRDISNENKMTKINVTDLSYSRDNDYIDTRKWTYRFDSDNDGDFSDEKDVPFGEGTNDKNPSFKVNHVGKYKIELKVKERFGQPTIERLVKAKDRRENNTTSKDSLEKIVHIVNIAPVVSAEVKPNKKVHLIIAQDDNPTKKDIDNLNTELNRLKRHLKEKKIELIEHRVKPSKTLGTYREKEKYLVTTLNVFLTNLKGEDEDGRYVSPSVTFLLDSQPLLGSKKPDITDVKVTVDEDVVGDINRVDTEDDHPYSYNENWKNILRLNISYKINGKMKNDNFYFALNWDLIKPVNIMRSREFFKRNRNNPIGATARVSTDIVDNIDELRFNKLNYLPNSEASGTVESIYNHLFLYGSDKVQQKREIIAKKYENEIRDIVSKIDGEDTYFINLRKDDREWFDKSFKKTLKDNNIPYKTLEDMYIGANVFANITNKNISDVITLKNGFPLVNIRRIWFSFSNVGLAKFSKDNNIRRYLTDTSKKCLIEKEMFYSDTPYNRDIKDDYDIYEAGSDEAIKLWLERNNFDDWSDIYSGYYSENNPQGYTEVHSAIKEMNISHKDNFYNCFFGYSFRPKLPLVNKDGTLSDVYYTWSNDYSDRHDYFYVEASLRHYHIRKFESGYIGKTKLGLVHSDGNIYIKEPYISDSDLGYANSYNSTLQLHWKTKAVITNYKTIYDYQRTKDKAYVFRNDGSIEEYDLVNGTNTTLETKWVEFNTFTKSAKLDDGNFLSQGIIIDGENGELIDALVTDGKMYVDNNGLRNSRGLIYSNVDINNYGTYVVKLKKNLSYNPSSNNSKEYIATVYQGGVIVTSHELSTPYLPNIPNISYHRKHYYISFNGYSLNHWSNESIIEDNWVFSWFRDKYKKINNTYIRVDEENNSIYVKNEKSKIYNKDNVDFEVPKNLINEAELLDYNSKSEVYDTLKQLMNSIFDDYRDYSITDKVTILINEKFEDEVVASDYENDPIKILDSKIEHIDPNYFENSMGVEWENVLKDKKFKKVGKYKYTPKAKDNPVGTDDRFDNYRLENQDNTYIDVYAHRRPIANLKLKKTVNFSLQPIIICDSSLSYDLDRKSTVDKGIKAYEYRYKPKNSTKWIKLSNHDKKIEIDGLGRAEYLVSLRVKDEYGVWSKDDIKEIKIDGDEKLNIKLSANLKTKKDKFKISSIPINETLIMYDIKTHYSKPTTLEYGIYKDGVLLTEIKKLDSENQTGSYNSSHTVYSWNDIELQTDDKWVDGNYTIKIKAYDKEDKSIMDSLELEFYIKTPINPKGKVPNEIFTGDKIDIKCSTSIYTDKVDLILHSGTEFEQRVPMQFEKNIFKNQNGVLEKVEKSWIYKYSVPEDLTDGIYKFKFIGIVETNPKKTEINTQVSHIIDFNIEEVEIVGAWNHWRGQIDLFDKQMLDMPHRFLSWEKVYITAKVKGEVDRVDIRMSKELESMKFRDRNGKVFRYEDDFGKRVYFPIKMQKKKDKNIYTAEYILPLANSTISWEDDRLGEPYMVKVIAHKNNHKKEYKIEDIDITGNTLDLVYVQPVSLR